MRAIIFITLLAIAFGIKVKTHFHMDMPSLKYQIDGYVYCEVNMKTGAVDVSKAIEAIINGTFTDELGASKFTEGKVVVPDPPLSNLDKIKVSGKAGTLEYNGLFKVSVWDVVKPKIPFNGHLKFSNGKEDDAKGLVDRPPILPRRTTA